MANIRSEFVFTVTALDERPTNVQRSAVARVLITVTRDSGPPQFVNAPYETTININQALNTSVFRLSAVDTDRSVSGSYDLFVIIT